MEKNAPLNPRSTKPGLKRLLITVITFVSFLLGTPFWYKSTQLYRASLPFQDIEAYAAWASSNSLELPCFLHVIFASRTNVPFSSKLGSTAAEIQGHIQRLLEGSSSSTQSCRAGFQLLLTLDAPSLCLTSGHEQRNSTWPCGLGTPSLLQAIHVSSDDGVDDLLLKFSTGQNNAADQVREDEGAGHYTIVVLQSVEGDGSSSSKEPNKLRTVVGQHRHSWIFGAFDSLSLADGLASKIAHVAVNIFGGGQTGSTEGKIRNMPISAEGDAILSFSLLNANPDDWVFDWNFEDLQKRFLAPVVKALDPIAQLKVESQVLHYTPKVVQSKWDPDLKAHVIMASQLPFFVNANEWHLDSSTAAAGRSKILHFAIYIPAVNEWPLQFESADGGLSLTNAFTSPSWGGVGVWNPKGQMTPSISVAGPSAVTLLTAKDFEPLAGVLVSQLRSLFGLQPKLVEDATMNIYSLPAPYRGFSKWELDILLRRRVMNDAEVAGMTLTSLARLVRKLPNMLIMDEISDQVQVSLSAAAAARSFAARGTYQNTADASRTAKSHAEAAFFQPSITSLLYNPSEHHLAIYTPFFVPVLLHVILAVVKETSRYRREWKRFKQKQKLQ